ncbi:auxin-responsive protein SAUR50-like isoform X2 [Dendrobium catenatum]|uniref:auxin-responsive protein SAUR50-like isoform X2 n=1 Tax=Dendrobium catenatum TaxID=906689 RepID=UPI00109FFA30|nr:auxin-responsive protein SAUR50-like isoform X2 [Dendrobium catenatum]
MSDDTRKLTGILQIVRLKQLLKKWKSITLGNGPKQISSDGGSSTAVNTKLNTVIDQNCDSDEDSASHSPEPPPDVPRGYLPVYVGQEKRRFVIPVTYLSSPVFKLLLAKAEEEFGFDHDGALTLPCEIEPFKYILQVMQQHQKGLINDGVGRS